MTRTIRLRERRTSTLRLRRADAEHLLAVRRHVVEVVPTTERGTYRVTPRGWVGALNTPNCRLLIEPKIPLSSLAWLLGPEVKALESAAQPGIDVWLATVLARGLAALMAERAA